MRRSRAQLHDGARAHRVATSKRLRAIVESPALRKTFGSLDGERLQRVPRGFPKDHPAAEYLRYRQFLAGCELEPSIATAPKFYDTILNVFRHAAPLMRFLNDPLLNRQ